MASVVLKMSVSLDGYVASVDGSADWKAGRSPDSTSWVLDTVGNACAHLVGAATTRSGPATGRARPGHSPGYLLAQGARFGRSLVQTGLIDEYRLVVHPVVLGAGERLFGTPHTIESVSATAFSGGAVAHVFAARP